MNAAALTENWWLWIPLTLGAAACTPNWHWSWVLSLELGLVGTEWTYVGATALATWPTRRPLIGVVWGGAALALAVAGMLNRRYQSLPERSIRL